MKKPYRIHTKHWYIERMIYLLAGLFVIITSLLSYFVNINWIFGTLLVGLMLINFSVSGYCPMAILLKIIGVKEK